MTSTPSTSRPPIPRNIIVRAIATVAMSALLTGGLFSLFYIAVFNAPEPHRLPIAVVGMPAADLQNAAGERFDIVQATDAGDGRDMLSRHAVYGVIDVDGGSRRVDLVYTSVDGASVLAYVQPLAESIASRASVDLSLENATPSIAPNASPGRSVFFAVFGTALTGFVLSQALASLAAQLRLSLRARVAIMGAVSVIAGLLISIMLDPWYSIAPGIFWSAWSMVSLLCLSAVATGTALLEVFGPLGQVLTAVLFVTLGNATATGILPMPFLTPPYQVISHVLPTGNVVRAVLGLAYFQGNGEALGYIVPAIWSIVSIGVVATAVSLRAHRESASVSAADAPASSHRA